VLRPPRRHRLHLLQRRDRAGVGVRARPAGAVLPGPAPGPQHRQGHGCATGADADVEPQQAARWERRGHPPRRPRAAVARVLLGAQAVHGRPDRAGARRAPRRAGHRAPRVPDAGGRRGPRVGLDRLHPARDRGRDRADDVRDRHGDQPRAAARGAAPPAHDLLPRPRRVPVLDDVPDPPRLPRLGARGARRRRGPQPGRRPRRRDRVRAGRPRAHARGEAAAGGGSRAMSRVLVVGSGIAGLSLALDAVAAGHEVTVVTKGELGQSNTRYAQGGVAAALFPDDSVASHVSDTLAAGAGLCDPEAVRVLCAEGPDRIRELIDLGVAFDTHDGELAHGLEAAHSFPRILHAGGDATEAAISSALVARLRERDVAVHEHAFLLALRTEAGPGTRVVGAEVELDGGARVLLDADAVVLATGGAGQLYPFTSNPAAATGDGVACAARAGARLADVELYQFHPTTLALPGNFLVSEAVRGEGAVLRNAAGERFMADVDGA